jgi:hypothetical protein
VSCCAVFDFAEATTFAGCGLALYSGRSAVNALMWGRSRMVSIRSLFVCDGDGPGEGWGFATCPRLRTARWFQCWQARSATTIRIRGIESGFPCKNRGRCASAICA